MTQSPDLEPASRQFEIWEVCGTDLSDYWMLVHSELHPEDWETYRAAVVRVRDGVPTTQRVLDTWARTMWLRADGRLVVADADGVVHTWADGSWSTAPLGCYGPAELWESPDGTLFCSAGKGRLLTLGDAGWKLMEPSSAAVATTADRTQPEDLFAIGGSGDDDLYLLGDRGVYHWFGGVWSALPTPTRARLRRVCWDGSEVHFVGSNGAFLTLRGGEWIDRSLTAATPHLSGIARYDGELYVGSHTRQLFQLTSDQLCVVAEDISGALRVVGAQLVAFSGERVQRFDGAQWATTSFDLAQIIDVEAAR